MSAAVITFDKLAYVDRLKASGIDEPQARAHAEALDVALRDTVATKGDLSAMKADLHDGSAALDRRIVALDHKIDVAVRDLTIRFGGALVVAVGAIVTILNFTLRLH